MAHLILDFDGTLADTGDDITEAANRLRLHRGLPPLGREQVLAHVGDGARHLVRALLPPLDEEEEGEALAFFREQYRRHPAERTRLYPGMAELLAGLPREHVAIVTNKPEDITLEILDRLGLEEAFAVVIGARPGRPAKPDPAPLREAMAVMGARPERTAMAGDGHQDMEAARGAGCLPLGVAWGFNGVEILREHGAARIVAHPAELAAWWSETIEQANP